MKNNTKQSYSHHLVNFAVGKSITNSEVENKTASYSELREILSHSIALKLSVKEQQDLIKTPKGQKDWKEIKQGPYLVSGHCKKEVRNSANLKCSELLMLEFDELVAEDVDKVVRFFSRYLGFIYSTAGSTPTAPRLRVILLLESRVDKNQYSEMVKWLDGLLRLLGVAMDASCESHCQPMYLPAHLCDVSPTFIELTGELLSYSRTVEDRLGRQGGKEREISLHVAPNASDPANTLEITPEQEKHLKLALDYIVGDVDAGVVFDRAEWIAIGHALKTVGNTGYELFMDFSKRVPSYDPLTIDRDWETFKPTNTSFKAVFAKASKRGWKNPFTGSGVDINGEFDNHAEAENERVRKRSIELINHTEYLKDPAPPKYVIDGLIEEESLVMIYAPAAQGKSFIALAGMLAIVTGNDFMGHSVTQGSCICILGEGHGGIRRRIHAWEEYHNRRLNPEEALLLNIGSPNFVDDSSFRELYQAVEQARRDYGNLKVLVVDTLARATPGADENNQRDMGVFIARMAKLRDDFGISVWAVHHTGHGDQSRARGSSALRAGMDAEFIIKKNGSNLMMIGTKMKEADLPQPIKMKLEPVKIKSSNGDFESAVAVHSDVAGFTAHANRIGKNEKTIYGLVQEATKERPVVSEQGFKLICKNQGIKDRACTDSLKSLIRKGVLSVENGEISISEERFS